MKKNKTIFIFIIVGVLLFGFLGYKVYNDFFKDKEKVKQLDSLELYGYSLTDNDTSTFKTEFEALRKTLNEDTVNYEEYAKSISKLFIIDLYTLDNKMGSTDIGGTEFIHPDIVDNFKENMGASLYKYVVTNIKKDRTQKLPEVTSVTIDSINKGTFKYNEKDYDSYSVKATWLYKEDLGYQTSAEITVIKAEKKLYIVKSK